MKNGISVSNPTGKYTDINNHLPGLIEIFEFIPLRLILPYN